MFTITDFIMKTLEGMVGEYPDFQIREYALNWHGKGKLTEEHLAEVDALIDTQYIEPEVAVAEEITETETEETTE